jgi:hypothetical protein
MKTPEERAAECSSELEGAVSGQTLDKWVERAGWMVIGHMLFSALGRLFALLK